MENPRPEKVAIVEEVRQKLEAADAVILTEYRGLKVGELEKVRTGMRAGGGEFKIYKNTLVRIAARELGLDLDELLTGPTAIAFVTTNEDGTGGDIAAVAKSLKEFAKDQPLLTIKGGVLGENVLDAKGALALADLPTAKEIYARLAGAINGQARALASVISGVHRSLGYVFQAAIDASAFSGESAPAAAADESADEAPADEAVADEAPAADEAPDTTEDAPAADAAESEN